MEMETGLTRLWIASHLNLSQTFLTLRVNNFIPSHLRSLCDSSSVSSANLVSYTLTHSHTLCTSYSAFCNYSVPSLCGSTSCSSASLVSYALIRSLTTHYSTFTLHKPRPPVPGELFPKFDPVHWRVCRLRRLTEVWHQQQLLLPRCGPRSLTQAFLDEFYMCGFHQPNKRPNFFLRFMAVFSEVNAESTSTAHPEHCSQREIQYPVQLPSSGRGVCSCTTISIVSMYKDIQLGRELRSRMMTKSKNVVGFRINLQFQAKTNSFGSTTGVIQTRFSAFAQRVIGTTSRTWNM